MLANEVLSNIELLELTWSTLRNMEHGIKWSTWRNIEHQEEEWSVSDAPLLAQGAPLTSKVCHL